MDAKHTPTPWTATHRGGSNFAVQAFDIRAGAYPIFQKSLAAIDGALVNCSPEDAAFIVRACNSHAALQEQNAKLREALEEARAIVRGIAEGKSYCMGDCVVVADECDVALHQVPR